MNDSLNSKKRGISYPSSIKNLSHSKKSNLTNLKNEDGQNEAEEENKKKSREMSTIIILVE